MDDRDQKNQIQCIVDEGILVSRRDMVRVLRDLGLVRYVDLLGGVPRSTGEGYVTSVVSNFSTSTIIVNRRLYLNVNNFEFIRLGVEEGQSVFDLVDHERTIRLFPMADALTERPPATTDEVYTSARFDRLFGDSLAEVYLDDDDDEE